MAEAVHERRRPRRGPRRAFLAGLALLALVFAADLLATPVARWYARRSLQAMEGYAGGVQDVQASIVPPTLRLDGLSLIEVPGGSWKAPLLYAERLEVAVDWRKLLRGQLVARVEAWRPKVTIVERARARQSPGSAEQKARRLPDLAAMLEEQVPLRVDRLELREAAALFVDATREPNPHLWVHGIDGQLDNVATRRVLSRGAPTTLALDGTVEHSGALSIRARANPWEKGLNFSGRARLEHLSASDLAALTQSTSGVKPQKGSISIFAEFRAVEGRLDSGVKTVARELEMAPAEDGAWNHIKSWIADLGIEIFSRDQGKGRPDVLATVVPIKGTVDDPQAQIWPTLLGVLRNAFVQGLESGFKNVPPPTAKEEENPLEQAADALRPGSGSPKAQPGARQGRKAKEK